MSTISQIKQTVNQLGQQATTIAGQLSQLAGDLGQKAAAVNNAIGGTSSGEDKEMIEAFQQASQAVKDAATSLQVAGQSAKEWAAKA